MDTARVYGVRPPFAHAFGCAMRLLMNESDGDACAITAMATQQGKY